MKNKRGITLIALVITIIVLLVLSGVSLSLVLGENGVLNKAQNATIETKNAEEKEKIEMAVAAARAVGHGVINKENLENELSKVSNNVAFNEDIEEGWKYFIYGKNYSIYKNGKVEENVETEEDNRLLPTEYQQVEYIESTGTQYIDTEYFSNKDTMVDLSFSYVKSNNDAWSNGLIFGSADNDNGKPSYSIGISKGDSFFYRNSDSSESVTEGNIQKDVKYSLKTNSNNLIVDENNYTNSNMMVLSNVQKYTAYLFARHQPTLDGGSFSKIFGKIYYCKIYDFDILKRDFIPCYSNVSVTDAKGKEIEF